MHRRKDHDVTPTRSERLLAASREHFGLVRLDPDSEQFMANAMSLAELVKRHQPEGTDPAQWALALATTSAVFTAVANLSAPEFTPDQLQGIRVAVMMLGAVGYLLGEPS
jgi:hypothetical protein